jgi:hypothetical protein
MKPHQCRFRLNGFTHQYQKEGGRSGYELFEKDGIKFM